MRLKDPWVIVCVLCGMAAGGGGGERALFEISHGEGFIYYLATPPAPESLNLLLDAVARSASVELPFEPQRVIDLRDAYREVELDAIGVPPGRMRIFAAVKGGRKK